LILGATDPVASMAGMTTTGGRLNAYRTLLNGDATPPSRIPDLAIADTGSTSLGLAWTATGDDSSAGTATSYDLRVSNAPIDSANFDAAMILPLPAPHSSGSAETFQVSGLPCSATLYFALRAVDDFGNPGPVSNLVSTTTLGVPALSLAPGTLPLTVTPGTVLDTVVTVANTGQGRLDFTVTSSAPGPWLTSSPTAGRVTAGGSLPVALHIDATGLATGVYHGTLTITANDPVTPAADVPVDLTVALPLSVNDPLPRSYGMRIASASPGPRAVTVELSLPADGLADISVFDVRGSRTRRVLHGTISAGVRTLRWDGTDEQGAKVAPGVYFVQARTSGGTFTRRFAILI
jgi:hypothetical protein